MHEAHLILFKNYIPIWKETKHASIRESVYAFRELIDVYSEIVWNSYMLFVGEMKLVNVKVRDAWYHWALKR